MGQSGPSRRASIERPSSRRLHRTSGPSPGLLPASARLRRPRSRERGCPHAAVSAGDRLGRGAGRVSRGQVAAGPKAAGATSGIRGDGATIGVRKRGGWSCQGKARRVRADSTPARASPRPIARRFRPSLAMIPGTSAIGNHGWRNSGPQSRTSRLRITCSSSSTCRWINSARRSAFSYCRQESWIWSSCLS